MYAGSSLPDWPTLSSVAVAVAALCRHPSTQFLPVAAPPWVFANQALPQQPLMLPPQWKKVLSPQSPKVVLIRPPGLCLSRRQLRSQGHGNFLSITRHLPLEKVKSARVGWGTWCLRECVTGLCPPGLHPGWVPKVNVCSSLLLLCDKTLS